MDKVILDEEYELKSERKIHEFKVDLARCINKHSIARTAPLSQA